MNDFTNKIISFVKDVTEHYDDQSLRRMLTLEEMKLYKEGQAILQAFVDIAIAQKQKDFDN